MDDDTPYRLSLRVRGRVQGVGYRAFVRKQARALGLRGWVRNEQDGSVSVVVEGARSELVALRKLCDEGPPFARVDQVEAIWDDPTGEFPGFDIRLDGR
ncbi:MAG: acylphosphatase [Myxococcales bacterium]|nr:acylphosphatase [Myxococcales bacterium]MCB9715317.1 acylphosphatase [Myxococcales bacterium]